MSKQKKSWSHTRYVLIRGTPLSFLMRFIRWVFVGFQKLMHPDLAQYMENTAKQAPVLFYPGCYIYSPETIRKTIRLLDHIGISYSILGGVSHCCGLPHLLQGEKEQAQQCFQHLHESLQQAQPDIIITGCTECLEAVQRVQQTYKGTYKVMSVGEFLLGHQGKFPQLQLRDTMLLHRSCRSLQQPGQYQASQTIIKRFSSLQETPPNKTMCCKHWDHLPKRHQRQQNERVLTKAAAVAPVLVCDCLTCYEAFQRCASEVEVLDIIDLFVEALDHKESS